MNNLAPYCALAVISLGVSGCFSYEHRQPAPTVITNGPVVEETVITTLPSGYRTRVHRGTTYYYRGDVYYRTYPRGGYVVVPRPW